MKLDTRAKQAVIRIADTLEDISMKLDHIIQAEDFFSGPRW